jgi:GT2 family glycosyltransferase
MNIFVIIPFYNHWSLTHLRLIELYQKIPDKLSIVLVDDASTDPEIPNAVSWWQGNGLKHEIFYYRNPENLGFIGSMNNGAKIAIQKGAELLVFLSNDVEVKKNFLPEMQTHLQSNPRILMGGRLIDFDSGWNGITYKGKKVITYYLEGWLLACTTEVWKELGGFDERYGHSDFEDVDISTTANYLKIPLILLNQDLFRHLLAQSYGYNPERLARTERNRKLWIEKWQGKWNNFWK